MTNTQKRTIANQILDYKLWVASIEQLLHDHRISPRNISIKLNLVKLQLSLLTFSQSINFVYEQFDRIEDILDSIQSALPVQYRPSNV